MKNLIINNTKYKSILEFPMPKKILEYVKFTPNGIMFYYRNPSNNFNILYENIKEMKLIFIAGYTYRSYYPLKSFVLKFTYFLNGKKNQFHC